MNTLCAPMHSKFWAFSTEVCYLRHTFSLLTVPRKQKHVAACKDILHVPTSWSSKNQHSNTSLTMKGQWVEPTTSSQCNSTSHKTRDQKNKTKLMTTNDSKHSHTGLPGSNEYMSFRLKTVWQQWFKICNRKGKIIQEEQWAEQWGVAGKQQLFLQRCGGVGDAGGSLP